MYTYTHAHIHTHARTRTNRYAQIHKHRYTCAYTYTCTCTYTYMQALEQFNKLDTNGDGKLSLVEFKIGFGITPTRKEVMCMYVCMYVCMFLCMYVVSVRCICAYGV